MLDRLPEKIDSKFRFVLLAAHRAEQMMRGARPRLDERADKAEKVKVAGVAIQEIMQGLVQWDYGPAPEDEPTESVEGGEDESETAEVH